MGDELFPIGDGQFEAAVHLGEHHGWHGALLLLAGLTLSRVQADGRLGARAAGRDRSARRLRDHERRPGLLERAARQARHRRLDDAERLYPGLKGVTLATIVLAGVAAWLIARERAILRR